MTRPLTAMTTAPTDPLSEVTPGRRFAPIGSNCSHSHVVTRCIAAVSGAVSGVLMLLALSHSQAHGGEVSCSESPLVFDLHALLMTSQCSVDGVRSALVPSTDSRCRTHGS
jgi:hypothetical protein